MTTRELLPAILVPLVVWRIYSRVRRSIGRQALEPKRLWLRIIILSTIIILLAVSSWRDATALVGLGAGLLLAFPLTALALKLTKFEDSPSGQFYTPNTTIGLAVTCIFVGRIIYRLVPLMGPDRADYRALVAQRSPLTLLVFGLTAGFYVAYFLGILIRGRKHRTQPNPPR